MTVGNLANLPACFTRFSTNFPYHVGQGALSSEFYLSTELSLTTLTLIPQPISWRTDDLCELATLELQLLSRPCMKKAGRATALLTRAEWSLGKSLQMSEELNRDPPDRSDRLRVTDSIPNMTFCSTYELMFDLLGQMSDLLFKTSS